MKKFDFQLAGDTGIHFYPKGSNKSYIENLLSCLREKGPKGIIDLIPSLSNLLVVFDPTKITLEALIQYVDQLEIDEYNNKKKYPSSWEIPICYDEKYGLDLQFISDNCNLSIDEVIETHQKQIYQVSMMGFLPGLPFLTELDSKLKMPRRNNPRNLVPSGSVGIAINQSVIYPQNSPGGWNLVGRTPINIFDQRKKEAILLSIGDYISFKKIIREEFEDVYEKNKISPVTIKKINHND